MTMSCISASNTNDYLTSVLTSLMLHHWQIVEMGQGVLTLGCDWNVSAMLGHHGAVSTAARRQGSPASRLFKLLQITTALETA